MVEVNTPDVDLSRTAAEPSATPERPQVRTSCQGSSIASESNLLNPGTGGLPSSSANSLSRSAGWQDSISGNQMPNDSLQTLQKSDRLNGDNGNQPEQLMQATGWVTRDDGKVDFIANRGNGVSPGLQSTHDCSQAKSTIKAQEFEN